MTTVIVKRDSDDMSEQIFGQAGPRKGEPGKGPRERMVRSAVALLARDGLQATGMRDVADHAQAPRGSIQHHFPGGKEQLTMEALAWIGGSVRAKLDDALIGDFEAEDSHLLPDTESGGDRGSAPGLLVLDRFVGMWRDGLIQMQVTSGCSVAAVVQDSDSPALLAQAAAVFASWREPFHHALRSEGLGEDRARALATTVIAALEGAVILSRAQRDIVPLEQTAAVLREVLLSATRPGAQEPVMFATGHAPEEPEEIANRLMKG